MCGNASTVRGLLKEIPANGDVVVIDMEATPEHFTRGTVRHIDRLLLVAEPWFKSLETARRYHHLATDLGIAEVGVVGNKVTPGDGEILSAYCQEHGFDLLSTIPLDPAVAEADRLGAAPIDHRPVSPAVTAIESLAARIESEL